MSEAGTRRVAVGILLTVAASFVVLHFGLARGARFVPDDLCQRANVAAYGALASQKILYKTWSGRWVSNGMVASAMLALRDPRGSFPFALALLGFVVATTWAVTSALLADRVRAPLRPLLALVTVAMLFFASPHRGDSWFFVFCALENVVPSCAALLALACACRADERRSWLVVPGALLAAVATGGHESVALPVLAASGGALAAAAWRDREAPRVRAGATMLAIAVLSFAISAASPGSSARLSQMPRQPFLPSLWAAVTEGPAVLLGIAREATAPLVTTLLAWAVAASALAQADPRETNPPLRNVLAVAAVVLLLAPIVAVTSSFPGFYSLGEPPPTRAQLVLAVFLVAAAVALGAAIGAALRGRAVPEQLLAALLMVAVLRVGRDEIPRTRTDIADARAYAAAYDARVALLRALPREPSREIVFLDPLPSSGVLRSAEIGTEDPAQFENRCLRRMLEVTRPLLRAKDAPAPTG